MFGMQHVTDFILGFRKKFLTSAVGRVKGLFQKNAKKQAGWLRKCLRKYSNEVSGFVLKILEKSKVIASMNP